MTRNAKTRGDLSDVTSKFKTYILCDVLFLVKLKEKFEIDQSWE